MTEPGAVALALVTACTAAAGVRRGRAFTRVVRMALAGCVAALPAAALVAWGGSDTHALLAVGALAGGLWLVIAIGRRDAAALTRERRTVLAVTRLCAWAVLLTLLARPACDRQVVAWEKPVLAVLLDHSASMGIVDRADDPQASASRAARANAVIAQTRGVRQRLDTLYDVRVHKLGARTEPADDWHIDPRAPLTALADALRMAGELRSTDGRPPVAVVLLSDGAENAADARAVRDAADDLAQQETALLTMGIGPLPGQTPLVELRPLSVPGQVGLRDRVHVAVGGRVQGCRGEALDVDVLWNEHVAASTQVPVEYGVQHLEAAFDVGPPGPGVHRLTARVTLGSAPDAQVFATSTLVEVVSDRVRVLYVERVPRAESVFVLRALRSDTALEVTPCFRFDDATDGSDGGVAGLWVGYDVIVLGRTGRLPRAALEALSEAVTRHGAGLLLVGGKGLFDGADYAGSALEDVSPVGLSGGRGAGLESAVRFIPTAAGLRHPALAGVAGAGGAPAGMAATAAWSRLPPLGDAARLGQPKPAATVLAVDVARRPLLAAHEAGRGRVLAAAWLATWPWALASDEGHALHQRFWRQMVMWLANRRPRAWVVTVRPEYALAALVGGQRQVLIRAGVAGLDAALGPRADSELDAELSLRRLSAAGEPVDAVLIPLKRDQSEWVAELGAVIDPARELSAATYELEFRVRPAGAEATEPPVQPGSRAAFEPLSARTRFTVVSENIEFRAPAADLPLLRSAAERTRGNGGAYADVTALPEVLERLAGQDRRQRVVTRTRYDLVGHEAWGLLAWLVLALGLEWLVRKRSGMP